MNIECPVPVTTDDCIRLGHGSGGRLTQQLLQEVILPYFSNEWLKQGHDSALLELGNQQLAFTTDSFVIHPLFFPGGDIGKLAVYGTVNDLLMAGAVPRFLSCSLILEEGFPTASLARVLASMAEAARETGVQLVTGDTKVVERGKGDGVYINTTGIGVATREREVSPSRIEPGDVILLSGDVGRHGMAVMATREGLEFTNPLYSDCASLLEPVRLLLDCGVDVHCLRDLTRGGLATALVELAEASGFSFTVREDEIPVTEPVSGACEMLGLDPLYVANEGRFIALIPSAQAEYALELMQRAEVSRHSCLIGEVTGADTPHVWLQTGFGSERLLDSLPGEQLPRIC